MRSLLALCRRTLLGLIVGLLLIASSSICHGGSVVVTGTGECADCQLNNIKSTKAFNGLRVMIDCKLANGEIQTRGTGELDMQGKFRVDLPEEIVEDGELKEECYAQLHSAYNSPCPTVDHDHGIESSSSNSKIIFVTKSEDGKHAFATAGQIKFSSESCASASLWPLFKYPPPLPKFPVVPFPKHPWFKKKPLPFPKPCPPSITKPLPPPVPVPVPVVRKPLPPPVVPVIPKPLPPPAVPVVPIPKPKPSPKPYPEPKPKPFPKPPVILPPPLVPIKPLPPFPYHKPLPPFPYHKPLPPFPFHKPLPPFPFHKPWSPIPKIKFPPIYKPPITFPPIYKPKYPDHPKKYWPPLPPITFPPIYKPKYPDHPKNYWPPLPFVPPHA
ncbi:hypothetical protein Dimus_002916 [Dionaea muscipula]